jgi:uncharacterized LabA/DUF88 family protein
MKTVAFIDGQNLFHCAMEAWGYYWPNFDAAALASKICETQGWHLSQTRFYTGMPGLNEDPEWHAFWSAKKTSMIRQGIEVFTRPLRYRNKETVLDRNVAFHLPDGTLLPSGTRLCDWNGKEIPLGTKLVARVGEEKGIDIRIALDIISLARAKAYDVAILFSQDQDLSEVAKEVKAVAKTQGRAIKVASAYPHGSPNPRGIDGTDWIRIDKTTYDACIDPRDYRRRKRI